MEDNRLARAKQLIETRNGIDAELATLRGEIEAEVASLFGPPTPHAKSTAARTCGECGKLGHNKKTCPDRQAAKKK